MMHSLSKNSFKAKLEEAKKNLPLPILMQKSGHGNKARTSAFCPFHDNQNTPAFSIFQKDGLWFWKCHSQCGSGDEITFIEKLRNCSRREAIRIFLEMAGIKADTHSATTKGELEKVYDYFNEAGESHFQLLRYKNPKGFSQRQIVHGKEIWNLDGVRRILYNLPQILKANRVWIVEGEKDADNLIQMGFIATTNPGGAGKWLPEYSEYLKGKEVILCGDNDKPGREHMEQVFQSLQGKAQLIRRLTIPSPFKDVSEYIESFTENGKAAEELAKLVEQSNEIKPKLWIEFCSPSKLRSYCPPKDLVLVGDYHIVRGAPFIISGPPGVGKSRSITALALAGATGASWFGLKIHSKFKTMIVQLENGPLRLKRELDDVNCPEMDEYVRICTPPIFGFAFDKIEFRDQLSQSLEQFKPHMVCFDPWNRIAKDDKGKDFIQAFEILQSILPKDSPVALGIVSHTRKPKSDEKTNGRALINLVAGSYVLGSVPRSIFVMQSASDDPKDNRIVWTCCKNNDGDLGAPSAWERRNGLFAPVHEFDWATYNQRGSTPKSKVQPKQITTLLENKEMTYSRLTEMITEVFDVCERTSKELIKKAQEAGYIWKNNEGRYENIQHA